MAHAYGGEPGTPEFIASYNEAAAQKIKTPTGLLFSLLQAYQASEDFRQLAPRTREDYKRIIQKEIEPEYSDFPLSGLTDKRTRGIFMEWRDKLALKSRRQADYAWTHVGQGKTNPNRRRNVLIQSGRSVRRQKILDKLFEVYEVLLAHGHDLLSITRVFEIISR